MDKVVSLAAQARANPVIQRSTNQDFLEAVRDLAHQRVVTDPSSVTLSDGLKAVQIMEAKKEKSGDTILILARIVTGNAPPIMIEGPVIDGEAVEV